MTALVAGLFTGALLLLAQAHHAVKVYDRPLDDLYRVRITATYTEQRPGVCCSTSVRVLLVDRADAKRYWEIATLTDEYEIVIKVQRADQRSIVLSRRPDAGVDHGSIKLFFDTRSRRLVRRIDFQESREIVFPDDAVAQRTLKVSAAGLRLLRDRGAFAADHAANQLPEPFTTHVLPTSTYREFARARPRLVRDGLDEHSATIEERVGAYQAEGDRLWFGKAFYDAEGETGVGAIGYLDASGAYTLLRIPELFDWSVLGFLVEKDTVWIARVHDGEGGMFSGGLLQYDRKTRRARAHPVPDVIHSITHVDGGVFLGTTHGLYVIRNGTQTRYRAEPDLDGRFIVVSENMTVR